MLLGKINKIVDNSMAFPCVFNQDHLLLQQTLAVTHSVMQEVLGHGLTLMLVQSRA